MKAVSWIYRKLTLNEFKAITDQIQSDGGGSQTYIDLPKGKISDADLISFFGEGISLGNNKGMKWDVEVRSLGLSTPPQTITISQRRDSSNCIREQNKEKRINIWKSEYSGFPDTNYNEADNPIYIFIIKTDDMNFYAGWFFSNDYNESWFLTKELCAPFVLDINAGYSEFNIPINITTADFNWPFRGIDASAIVNHDKTKTSDSKTRTNSLQVIYYGAPGTGKSHQTDKLVEGDKQNKIHQRTTFHPDSDYSSFVGCYKPSKENGELTYKFVPQAFLKAYVAAWKNHKQPYYLVIEEINRGNCAQIFGDIFQLLDRREDGFSKYHITSDTDIATYLRDDAFADISADELPIIDDINIEQILSGEIMQLPSNLYIYATMNTSDQSLFPIDSAFKRRWEWEYKPIEQPQDPQYRDWKIVTDDGAAYDWWAFLNAVNDRIFETTQSEDKKMGYWFTKADTEKRISQKKFIGKVLFYLWNDVFKDYARTESTVFKVFKDDDKKETEEYTFTDFFRSEGVINRIHRLMLTLGIEREEWDDYSSKTNEGESYSQSRLNITVGNQEVSLRKAFYEITRQLITKDPIITFDTIKEAAKDSGFTKRQFDILFLKEEDMLNWRETHKNDSKIDQRYLFSDPLVSGDNVKFYVTGQGWVNSPECTEPLIKYADKFSIQISVQ